MKIVSQSGQTPERATNDLLQRVVQKLQTQSGRSIQIAVAQTIKRHFQTIYPGSKHYSPDNVLDGEVSGHSATVVVNVPGITRAYHNMDIKPVKAKKLTIPVHREAYGLSAKEVNGLFYAKNAKGTEMLAKIEGGALVAMYILKDQVHQSRDKRLMPSDQTIADNVGARLATWLRRTSI